jgi:hypothetical protein
MGRRSGRAVLTLSDEQRTKWAELAASRTSISEIQRQLGVSRLMIYTCIEKCPAPGVQAGLKDIYHRTMPLNR